jgi:hypothetical protein
MGAGVQRRGQRLVVALERDKRGAPVGAVDVDDDQVAGEDRDVGVWPPGPPGCDPVAVAGGVGEAVLGARVLAGLGASGPPARAAARNRGVDGEDGPAARGVRERRLQLLRTLINAS